MIEKPAVVRTRWAAVGAAVAITLGAVGLGGLNIASADVSEGDRPVFISINPCRLLDTRPGDATVGPKSSPLGPGETYTVTAHGDNGECVGASTIPTDALSLSLNVTAVGATAPTFLTFWGAGANPGTSNLNPRPGAAPTPNSVNTPLSASGTFNIYNDAGSVGAIVDVNGYYAHHDHDDRYAPRIDLIEITTSEFLPNTAYFGGTPDWQYEGYWFTSDANAGCLLAPVNLPTGRPITSVKVRHAALQPVEFLVEMYVQNVAAGSLTDDTDARAFSETFAVDTTPALQIAETEIALPTDPIAGAAGSDATIAVCSNDEGALLASVALGFD